MSETKYIINDGVLTSVELFETDNSAVPPGASVVLKSTWDALVASSDEQSVMAIFGVTEDRRDADESV